MTTQSNPSEPQAPSNQVGTLSAEELEYLKKICSREWWDDDSKEAQSALAPFTGITASQFTASYTVQLFSILTDEISRLRQVVRILALAIGGTY